MNNCVFCGKEAQDGAKFSEWVKPTFTDFDKLLPGERVCNDCLFFFEESSDDLRKIFAKEKGQRMRNYSHFIVNGQWIPLSKANKMRMRELLTGEQFPELAVIADSGQKHIVFRALRNPLGSQSGWVQFEEQRIYVDPSQLRSLIDTITQLLVFFSKSEIESGRYIMPRIQRIGIDDWIRLEAEIKACRGAPIFSLALFLSQKAHEDENDE